MGSLHHHTHRPVYIEWNLNMLFAHLQHHNEEQNATGNVYAVPRYHQAASAQLTDQIH